MTSPASRLTAFHAPHSASTLAVVLAGGNGTRLGALTRRECKPALPFGGLYRNIDFPLSNCVHSGIRRIAVLTQYKSQTLINHIEAGWSFLPRHLGEYVDLWPAQLRSDSGWYTGTANALFQNLDLMRATRAQVVLVLSGDHIYRMDYRRLLSHHMASGADLTISCVHVPANEAAGFGVVSRDGAGRPTGFIEKPAPPQLGHANDSVLASMGIYVFNADYLYERLVRDAASPTSTHDFGRDLIPAAVAKAEANACVFCNDDGTPGYWRDVGTLDSYWSTHMDLVDPAIDFELSQPDWPIFTHQPQLPPARLLSGRRPVSVHDSIIAPGCRIEGAALTRSVLGHGVQVGADSALHQVVALPDAQIGVDCRLHRVIVDSGCVVPSGTVVGEDFERDAERFEMSEHGVALVTRESVLRAARQVA